MREHAAAAVANGLALSKLRAYQAGFLIFSDFQRGALRLSALMELPLIHIYTHDSIGVGEDGPTHQPIEQLASIRAMPGVIDMRPGRRQRGRRGLAGADADPARAGGADAVPPAAAHPGPASATPRRPGWRAGAYVLADPPDGEPEVILIATGSEVAMTVDAYEQLTADGIRARVVSHAVDGTVRQAAARPTATRCCRRRSPPGCRWRRAPRSAGTAGSARPGAIIGMSTFGASAPLKVLQAKFGFTVEHIVATARAQLGLDHDTDAPGVTLETSETDRARQ